jgi:hypothetical protein
MIESERFFVLVELCLDREASEEEMAELQALLREEPEARERFWEAAEWHGLYRQWGEQESGRVAAQAVRRGRPVPGSARPVARAVRRGPVKAAARRKIVSFPFWKLAAGIAAMAAVVVLVLMNKSPVPMPAPVATLAQVSGAVWSTSEGPEQGARLKPGRLELERGAVVIAFDRGAHVVLEGPADFELLGDNSSVLRAGRLRAHVPASAHGFMVKTPQFTAVDLGTEFGCDLAPSGIGELHVFAGRVDLSTDAGPGAPVELHEDQAMRIDHGATTSIPAQPSSFLSEDDLARREFQEKGDFLDAWRIASRELDENPATLLHFDFEGAPGGMLPNRALQGPPGLSATVLGCQPAEGRWAGKGALTFQSPGDRIEFALPGQFQSLTLLAWVRVASLHAGHNPLIVGGGAQPGSVHWYIYHGGGLGLDLGRETDPNRIFLHTRQVIMAQNLDSWVFVACVIDGATGSLTEYLNGELVGARFGFACPPLELATADVGNAPEGEPANPDHASSNFNGSIDELAVLSTPLSGDDIAQMYQMGKSAP